MYDEKKDSTMLQLGYGTARDDNKTLRINPDCIRPKIDDGIQYMKTPAGSCDNTKGLERTMVDCKIFLIIGEKFHPCSIER